MTSELEAAPLSPPPGPSRASRVLGLWPGLAVVLVISGVAMFLGSLVPIIGGPVFGIVIGAILAIFIRPGTVLEAGTKFAGKRVLQASIVILGTGLSLTQVLSVGLSSLPVMLGTLAVALVGAWLVGRMLRVNGDIRTLIGVGTGICGASAIAATTAVIGAADAEVAYAIGTIFTFNIAAVLLFPMIGHLLGLSQHAFGLWAGTAINDTSSVVAAAYTFGASAGAYAVVVKLTRTLMIIPISIVLAAVQSRKDAAAGGETARRRVPWKRIVPLFIIGFLVASALDTVGVIPVSWHPTLSALGVFMITMALTGIGFSTRLSTLRKAGARPLLLGGILWVLVAVTSLLIQLATGTL
ncbi:MAG: hypothetical protein QOI70_346 [Microbacteriaceae bacterium]|nr:hypothetical protein [Microbacteriaceae bacterium]